MKIVILAGGSGTRLWPKSRKSRPKQFTKVLDGLTMIEETYQRFLPKYGVENIFFSTVPAFKDTILSLFPDTPPENVLAEPEKRDNAAAYGYVCSVLAEKYGDEPVAFIPSDHYIKNSERFVETLDFAEKTIRETGKMLDISLEPSFPSTVLGYTKVGDVVSEENGIQLVEFKGHTEKPDFAVAKEYLDSGDYLWHGSYYMWTPNSFLNAYKQYAPAIHEKLEVIQEALSEDNQVKLEDAYGQIEKISIDYAITEKMNPEDVLILKGDFGWSDIGAWDMLYDLLKKEQDEDQNLIHAEWEGIDTSGTYVSAPDGKLVATIGVDDLIIVDTEDALLVCPKSKAQEVKKVVESLKNKEKDSYL